MTTGMSGNVSSPTGQTGPGPKWDAARLAAALSLHVKSLVVTVFWAIVGFASLTAGYVAFRGILWAAREILRVLGV